MLKIQPRMKDPFTSIGSGKVSRIVDVCKRKEKPIPFKPKRKFKNWTILTKKKKIQASTMNFHTTKVKRIFMYWNTKGYPFRIHRMKSNKTVDIALSKALKASKEYELQTIINAIDLCHQMFTSKWMKFNVSFYGIMKLGLGDFFKFDESMMISRHRSLKDAGITSWFKECSKGEEYLRKRYSYYIQDDNPHLTKKLKQIWKNYKGRKLRPENINAITACCNKAVAFADLNKKELDITPTVVLDTIDNMINNFKEYKPMYVNSLNSSRFWGERLPSELVRFGTVSQEDEDRIKLLDDDEQEQQ